MFIKDLSLGKDSLSESTENFYLASESFLVQTSCIRDSEDNVIYLLEVPQYFSKKLLLLLHEMGKHCNYLYMHYFARKEMQKNIITIFPRICSCKTCQKSYKEYENKRH